MAQIKAFLGVARAPFLLLPVTLVAAGAGVGRYVGGFSWWRTGLALVGLVALHMAVNILNEWSDLRTGIDLETVRTPFSGGSGTLPAGGMSAGGALVFGLVCAAIGLVVGLVLLAEIGWPLLPFLVLGAVCVLGYTDFLARVGLGELAAGLGLGGLPVAGVALVEGAGVGPVAVAAAIPATLMTFNLLLLNELPDEAADRAGGRRNLVTIFGRHVAARVWAVAALLTPAALVVAVALGALPALALVAALPTLLLVPGLRWTLAGAEGEAPIPVLGANVAWNLATNSLLALALAFAA